MNNPEKGSIALDIVHRALWEYLTALSELEDEAKRETLWREIFEAYGIWYLSGTWILTYSLSCQDVLAEMVHTKNGSRIVREFIARGSAKVIKTDGLRSFNAHAIIVY